MTVKIRLNKAIKAINPSAQFSITNEDFSTFEKNLEAMIEEDSSTSSSVEDSILKKIRSR